MTDARMLNWLCRYGPARREVLDERGGLRSSLVDVGSGPHGIACTGTDVPFVGLDTEFPLAPAPSMLAVRNRPGRLPFADGAFGTVLSLDVLEHVPPADRAAFVAELARVAAERVVVACPSSDMAAVDDLVRGLFTGAGLPVPGWLAEHDEHGLPTPAEIEACCRAPEGFVVRPLRVPNALLSTMASIADFMPATAPEAIAEATRRTSEWLAVFDGATFGDSWRKGYVLERTEPGAPLVDHGALETTALAALRCQDCAGAFARVDEDLLSCSGCGRLAPRTRAGVWDLTAAQFAGLPTDGAGYVWCSPAWDEPERLAATLRALPFDAAPAVVLRARPQDIEAQEAARRALAVLAAGGTLPAADVIVVDEPLRPEDEQALRAGGVVVA